jgi:uncharacterized membrane protein
MPRHFLFFIAVIGFFGLFLLMMAGPTLIKTDHGLPTALLLILTAGPLLLPLRGFLDKNLKSCTWLTYLSLPYFAVATAELYTNPAIWLWNTLQIFSSLLLCFGAGMYVYTAEKKPK